MPSSFQYGIPGRQCNKKKIQKPEKGGKPVFATKPRSSMDSVRYFIHYFFQRERTGIFSFGGCFYVDKIIKPVFPNALQLSFVPSMFSFSPPVDRLPGNIPHSVCAHAHILQIVFEDVESLHSQLVALHKCCIYYLPDSETGRAAAC